MPGADGNAVLPAGRRRQTVAFKVFRIRLCSAHGFRFASGSYLFEGLAMKSYYANGVLNVPNCDAIISYPFFFFSHSFSLTHTVSLTAELVPLEMKEIE